MGDTMYKYKMKDYIFKDKKSNIYQDTFNDYGYNIENNYKKEKEIDIEKVKYDINKNYYSSIEKLNWPFSQNNVK